MPTITRTAAKDGTARYEVQVRLAGAPPKFATFRKLVDAKRWAQEVEVELREKRAFGRNLSSKRTLSQREEVALTHATASRSISATLTRTIASAASGQTLLPIRRTLALFVAAAARS